MMKKQEALRESKPPLWLIHDAWNKLAKDETVARYFSLILLADTNSLRLKGKNSLSIWWSGTSWLYSRFFFVTLTISWKFAHMFLRDVANRQTSKKGIKHNLRHSVKVMMICSNLPAQQRSNFMDIIILVWRSGLWNKEYTFMFYTSQMLGSYQTHLKLNIMNVQMLFWLFFIAKFKISTLISISFSCDD